MRSYYILLLGLFISIETKAQLPAVYTPTIVKGGTGASYVQIITKAVFPDVTFTLGHSFFIDRTTNTIRLRSCYSPGSPLTMITTLTETINIGLLYQGNYTLDYEAYQSSSFSDCAPYDTLFTAISEFYLGPNSIQEINLLDDISLAPNPVKDKVKVLGNNFASIDRILIYNSLGQNVKEYIGREYNSEIDIDLLPGIYSMAIQSGTRSKIIKFIKE